MRTSFKDEDEMLNRLSVNALLKSAFGLMAAVAVVLLSISAWDSFTRFKVTGRMTNSAEASIHLFAALHNLRLDRSSTGRDMNNEKPIGVTQNLRVVRDGDAAAFKASVVALKAVEFPAGSTTAADFEQNVRKFLALQQETEAALSQPKAQRRAGLNDEYQRLASTLLEQLDQISSQLAQMVKLQDAYVDQLMQLKGLAWIMREGSGDAAFLINNGLYGLRLPADAVKQYISASVRARTALGAIEQFAVAMPLPESFKQALHKAKTEALSDEYQAKQYEMITAMAAGKKIDVDPAAWSGVTRPKQAMLLRVAEIALDLAKSYSEDQHTKAQRNLFLQIGLLALAIGLSVAMVFLISRRITNPLLMVQKVMDKIAGGDFNTSLPKTSRQDEIGKIVTAVNSMVEQVSATIAGIKASAREVTNASGEIALATTDLSQRTEEQAASLEETSASMAQISDTVRKNAENARRAQQSALSTQKVADHGGEVAGKAVHAMARIEELSGKIGDIIGVIDEIARQTNLLALNAAVEAARAGEAGRGFAVVATEVRSLAQRSSQAAKDIAELITNSGAQVKDGVALVNEAGNALHEIVDSIREVASLVSDIATASSEQATGLEEVGKALAQMDEVTQRNSALVEENAATAQTLEQQARAMDEQVAYFRTEEDAARNPLVKGAQGKPALPRPTKAAPQRQPLAA